MEILAVIGIIYCIHLLDKWFDQRSAAKFVKKITGKTLEQ